jgi:hypothetical protein
LSPRRIDVLAIIGDDRSGFVAAKVVDTSYEVGIDTEILSPDGKVYERWGGFHFASVGAPMREWLLGSCKAALFQIIDAVGEETPGWTIRYRTAILPGYDPGWADFTGLSFSRITEFRRFALDELRIMANYREWEEDAIPAPPTKPTSTLRFILGLIWSATKRDLSRANARLF